ncbi:hypothetical protein K458DRAFT_381273 [Lentithecium fluviatile CBS 122367]|uniref:Uncharacterized protein n=1 Tax=Lentithecium fluviatile CBS 122367 TaxID=1168545 RepID=A0A6G1JLQ3_9PLEO|nr:hypothetical protein K458DRAFT_381273 [Lentithecium fluviatile CBS 122367]
MLLFPNLRKVEIKMQRREREMWGTWHEMAFGSGDEEEKLLERVPSWFRGNVERIVRGRCYRWQVGEKWTVEWPQLDPNVGMGSYVDAIFTGLGAEAAEKAMRGVDGIEPCACGCGAPCWLSAVFVQDGGRRVAVDVVFYGDGVKEEERGLRVRLTPGVEPLDVRVMTEVPVMKFGDGGDAVGFGWDGEREFWEGVRRNRGFWGRWWSGQ